MSKNTDAGSLKEYFSDFGEVVDSVVMTDRMTGETRGFGFITFQNFTDVQSCLKQPSHLVDKVQVGANSGITCEVQVLVVVPHVRYRY